MTEIESPAYDIRQSEPFAAYIASQGWLVEQIGSLYVYVKRWGLLGSVAKILRCSSDIDWIKLKELQKKYRIFTTRIEPLISDPEFLSLFPDQGFFLDTQPLRPTKTLRIDLGGSNFDLLKRFKRARSWIHKLQHTGYETQINRFDDFFQIWQQATRQQHIWISTKVDFDTLVGIFGHNCFCVTLNQSCGCLVLIYKKTAYYYYAAALPVAKEQELPYAVVWEAMLEAKRRGCVIWDFESLYDDRWPNQYTSWKGFSQFKKTFGGTEVLFPGCFTQTDFKKIFYW